jgi:formamidopyrimidine-DNA glycosylase
VSRNFGMPELPEVEAVCRAIRRALRGRRILSVHVIRRRVCLPQTPQKFAKAAAGRRILSIERRGKNILIRLEGITLWIHLRMTGSLYTIARAGRRPASSSAYLVLDDGRALVFDDPRGLGIMRAVHPLRLRKLLTAVGVDPLSSAFTPRLLAHLARSSRRAIKPLLMDQRRIAGLGNIYAAEALFRAGIDPRRPAARLSPFRLLRLHRAIRETLAEATKSATLAYRRPGRFSENETFHPAVYGREGRPCRRCGRRIRRTLQSGRSTYFCPGCQT